MRFIAGIVWSTGDCAVEACQDSWMKTQIYTLSCGETRCCSLIDTSSRRRARQALGASNGTVYFASRVLYAHRTHARLGDKPAPIRKARTKLEKSKNQVAHVRGGNIEKRSRKENQKNIKADRLIKVIKSFANEHCLPNSISLSYNRFEGWEQVHGVVRTHENIESIQIVFNFIS